MGKSIYKNGHQCWVSSGWFNEGAWRYATKGEAVSNTVDDGLAVSKGLKNLYTNTNI